MRSKLILALFLIFLVANSTLSVLFKLPGTEKSLVSNSSSNEEDNNEVKVSSSNNDFALTLKFEPPPSFPDDGYFTYDTYNPNTEASLVTSFDTSGYIGDTIAADDAYYIGHIDANEYAFSVSSDDKIDEGYWYLYFRASIPASYLGTISVKYKVRMTIEGGDALQFIYTDTFDATADYIINGHIYLEIKAKFYDKASYWEGEYYDDFEIDTFVYLMKWDGTKVLVASHDNDPYTMGSVGSTEGTDDCYLMVDQVKLTTTYYYSNVIPEHTTTDNYVLHKVTFDVSYAGTKVTFLNLPRNWVFYNASPAIDWNDTEKSFYAIIEGTYTLYFISYNTWNYPQYELSRVAFFNSRGEFLNFDSFHTYIAESPTRLIRYAPDINDPDLVAWFRFNEGEGSVTYDWKNNLQGIIHGATWVTGYIGKALSFDGTDDYVEADDVTQYFVETDFTVEAWIKCTDISGTDTIVGRYDSSGNNLWVLCVDGTGQIYFHHGPTTTNRLFNARVTNEQWYHIVFEREGTIWKLFLNGRFIGSYDLSIPDESSNDRFSIGQDWDGSSTSDFFDGLIDEVRIYKRALTPEEIWWHYCIVLYFDGYRDILGREPDTDTRIRIVQGVFGYASEFDYSKLKYEGDDALRSLVEMTCIAMFYRYGYRKTGAHGDDYFVLFEKTRETSSGTEIVFLESLGSVILEFRTEGYWHSAYTFFDIEHRDKVWTFVAGSISYDGLMTVYYTNKYEESSKTEATSRKDYAMPTRDAGSAFIGYTHGFNRYAWGLIDELIVLREPLSLDMMKKLYHIAEKYIGGYYTDESFRATWDIEQDSPEDGYGFAEDFSDISEWDWWAYQNAYSSRSATTDGDILTLYADFPADSSYGFVTYGVDFTDFDLANYPFIEVRWKGETNASTYLRIFANITDGGSNTYNLLIVSHTSTFDWEIVRVNLYELAKAKQSSWSAWYLSGIYFDINDNPDDVAQYGKIYVDWIRIYRIEGYKHYDYYGQDSSYWATSIGGILQFHATFDNSGDEYHQFEYDIPDSSPDYAEVRIKGDYVLIRFSTSDGYMIWWFSATDWATVRFDLKSRTYTVIEGSVNEIGHVESGSSSTITGFIIGINDYPNNVSSGTYDAYFDYIRIGYLQEKIHDTEWEPLLYPLYQHPKYGYVWFNVTDIWGNQLAYEPRPYHPYQDFIFQVYSWKFKNARDDTFVKITLQQEGSGFYYSEWIGPGELTEYILYPGTYYLGIYYPLTDETSSYTITINDDTYFLLTGYTLADIINNQEEIMDQIVSVNITLLNVNSTIMNQVIDVNINLVNVNTTLYDLIIDTQNMVINVNTTIKQINETLYNEIINSNATITSMIIDLDNKIISINTTMETYYINITNQLDLVNSTLYNLILDVQTMVQQQNVTIYDMWVDLNNSIVAVNSSLGMMIIDLRNNITVMNTTIMNMLVNISDNIVLVQNNIYTLNETILLKFRDLDNNITQYFTTTWDKIATLDEMIRRFFNRFTWELYNPLTGLGIESELFRVYINDRRVFQHEYYTLADNVSIVVTDYWDRVWYNASHPANATIKIGIPVGRLIIYNDLDRDITVNITLKDDPLKRNITIVILKGTAVVLDLPLGDYYITVISIDYKTLKVELRTLLVSVALSDTGKEVVVSQPEIHVNEDFWGKIKQEAPQYIIHGFLFGLGSIAASLLFAAIWLTDKKRKKAELSLGTGPIRYSYQVTVSWKDIILITLLIICALLIYLLLI